MAAWHRNADAISLRCPGRLHRDRRRHGI